MQRLSGVLMVLAGTALGGYMILPARETEEILFRTTSTVFPAFTGNRDTSHSVWVRASA